ncbi:hypothetical protein IAU60_000589 [Kwoniella sp. DSM 27419]
MCGLTLTIHVAPRIPSDPGTQEDLFASLGQANARRGPDVQRSHAELVELPSGHILEVTLSCAVLGLRGDLTAQPMVGTRGVLGWNGQVFEGLGVGRDENDTRQIFDRLEAGEEVQDVLRGIEGPFAFIYLDLIHQTIHYQLDPLSRRSLLIHPVDPCSSSAGTVEQFVLSSCRSSLGREQSVEMRALLGGEGGVLRLKDICVSPAVGPGLDRINVSQALHTRQTLDSPESSTAWTRVKPTCTSLPDDDLALDDDAIRDEVPRFIDELRASIKRRVENIPDPSSGDARVAVLFSGGIDCTFLACLLHQLSGRDAVVELKRVCPGREWRFVEVNVPFEESQGHKRNVLDLMYPSSTEMDLSLALPLYFASRGHGTLQDSDEPYHVRAKVYISGLGADEQLGGYARHRHAYQRNGWQGLIDETQMDISRLPTRNLSRDDRLLSSHARDARYPYLSLSFIAYLSSLPIHLKCDPRYPEGQGDKILLRKAVASVGMARAAVRVKRAMQFGTRSSKVGGTGSGVKGPKAGERTVA